MTLLQIVAATLAGGLLSALAAAALSLTVLERWTPRLIAYSVGILLAAAFLNLLPEALDLLDHEEVLATCLGGILGFFLLNKVALWRHAHEDPAAHQGASKASGMMILLGDGLHNFVDGILIAAAFLSDPMLGWTVTVGIVAHEIPQEIGDFAILLQAGYSRKRALILNSIASLSAVAGGLLGYFALSEAEAAIPYVLALSAASFIYIAVADLIPGLNRTWSAPAAATQMSLIAVGIGTLWLLHSH